MQKLAREPGKVSYDEVTGMPLDPKLVAGAIKEELMFMRKLRVYHEVLVSYLDKSGLKAIGTRWVYTNKGDAANPFIRARACCARNSLMLSRCMTGKRRAFAEERFWDSTTSVRRISHNPARRTHP